MKFVGHVPRIREGEMHTYVWSGYLKGREYLEDLAVDGWEDNIKTILYKLYGKICIGNKWLKVGIWLDTMMNLRMSQEHEMFRPTE